MAGERTLWWHRLLCGIILLYVHSCTHTLLRWAGPRPWRLRVSLGERPRGKVTLMEGKTWLILRRTCIAAWKEGDYEQFQAYTICVHCAYYSSPFPSLPLRTKQSSSFFTHVRSLLQGTFFLSNWSGRTVQICIILISLHGTSRWQNTKQPYTPSSLHKSAVCSWLRTLQYLCILYGTNQVKIGLVYACRSQLARNVSSVETAHNRKNSQSYLEFLTPVPLSHQMGTSLVPRLCPTWNETKHGQPNMN